MSWGLFGRETAGGSTGSRVYRIGTGLAMLMEQLGMNGEIWGSLRFSLGLGCADRAARNGRGAGWVNLQ